MENENQRPPLPTNWAFRFFAVWSGQAVSLLGSSLVQFALIWYLTKESGSATVLATATLLAMLPDIVFGPFVGALVDRLNRHMLIIAADASIMFATLGLVYLFATDQIQIWHIYALMFVRGLGGAFHWPAMQASTSLMVPDEQLSRIAGMNQTLQGIVSIVAPPVGAMLIEVLTTHQVLMIDVGTALLAILPLFFIGIPQPIRNNSNGTETLKTNYWQDVKEGFSYVIAWKGLLGIIILAAMINFILSPTSSLMPLLVTDHFNGDALQFGLTSSFWGGGVILGGIALSVWGGFKRKIATSLMGIVGIGIGIIAVGVAPTNAFWLALTGMFISGTMGAFANGPMMAVIQSVVRPDMQGRVMSLLGSFASAMSPIGLIIAGPVSDAIGIRTWYWIAGGLIFLMGIIAFSVPAIMNVENNQNGALSTEEAVA